MRLLDGAPSSAVSSPLYRRKVHGAVHRHVCSLTRTVNMRTKPSSTDGGMRLFSVWKVAMACWPQQRLGAVFYELRGELVQGIPSLWTP